MNLEVNPKSKNNKHAKTQVINTKSISKDLDYNKMSVNVANYSQILDHKQNYGIKYHLNSIR